MHRETLKHPLYAHNTSCQPKISLRQLTKLAYLLCNCFISLVMLKSVGRRSRQQTCMVPEHTFVQQVAMHFGMSIMLPCWYMGRLDMGRRIAYRMGSKAHWNSFGDGGGSGSSLNKGDGLVPWFVGDMFYMLIWRKEASGKAVLHHSSDDSSQSSSSDSDGSSDALVGCSLLAYFLGVYGVHCTP